MTSEPGRPAEPALVADGVSKRFGTVTALDDVSLSVPRGSIFGLLGPNGAGKTTLFSIAAGFVRADRGSLRVLGTDIGRVAELHGRMTILPQDARFDANLPVLEQLAFLRMLDGREREQAEQEVLDAFERVGLRGVERRTVGTLSHGNRKRVGVAQAFLGEPELILLDEPTAGLDPANARQIRDLVLELQRERGVTTVISSHNLAEIQEMCDHVAILDRGRRVASGPVLEVTRARMHVELALDAPLSEVQGDVLAALDGILGLEVRGPARYRLSMEDGADVDEVLVRLLQEVLAMDRVPRLLSTGSSLEEVFLQLTRPG